VKLVCDSVSVFVFRLRDGMVQYLLLKRTDGRGGFWQPVSGTIQKGELAEATACREAEEETGLEFGELIVLEKVHSFFKPGKRRVYFEPCFALEATGGSLVMSAEHTAHEWLSFDDARSRVPFAGLREALDELDARLTAEG
jgi:8-oxo-dGTP pyrophosphatase MutT (NUDIX family)